MIRSHAWFSAAIILTLALGIGINTTVFTLVNAVLFKPVPLPGGSRLVVVRNQNLNETNSRFGVSYPDFIELRKQNSSLETLEAANGALAILSETGNPPARYRMATISPGLFPMVHTSPVLGRGFTEADAKPGADPVILISHRAWQGRYGGTRDVVGRVVRVNGQPTTIAGVMPEGFLFPSGQDVWSPLIPNEALQKRSNQSLTLYGVLRETGPSLDAARADLAVIGKQLSTAYPDTNKDIGVTIETFHQAYNGGNIRTIFLLMLGAVGFVLLIACANVANMMLSRALARRRENSVRAALGASRWQLVRQLLVESVLLSCAGGILGLGLSRIAVHYFDLATLSERPYWIAFGMDYLAFTYFALISILSGVLFGVLPALRSSRVDLAGELKEGTRNMVAAAAGGTRGGRLAGTLVILQFALTMILLSGAGLMMRSFFKAQTLNEFIPDGQIFTARVTLPDGKGETYEKREDRIRFYEDLERRLAALPGASQVAISADLPGGGSSNDRIEIEGRAPATSVGAALRASYVVASPSYLPLIGLNLVEGRGFETLDGDPGREAAIVTQQFAARFWPGQSAIGKRFRMSINDKANPWIQVIGVSNDMLQNPQQGDEAHPLAFLPYRQLGWRSMNMLVRTRGMDPSAMARPVKALVQELDQDLPVFDVRSLKQALEAQRWFLPVFGSLFLSFAAIGLLIASLGIYAVGAQAAANRTREIGIRMALGATTRDILRIMLSRGVFYLIIGLSIGLAGALAATRLMKGFLIQVSPQDPVVLSSVAILLAAIGLLACWLPAKRAAALHPLRALREE